jgi:hypothetical protein
MSQKPSCYAQDIPTRTRQVSDFMALLQFIDEQIQSQKMGWDGKRSIYIEKLCFGMNLYREVWQASASSQPSSPLESPKYSLRCQATRVICKSRSLNNASPLVTGEPHSLCQHRLFIIKTPLTTAETSMRNGSYPFVIPYQLLMEEPG